MDLFGSLFIACSMYSRIPVPQVEWTEKRMKYAMCFFPVIGLVIGCTEVLSFVLFRFMDRMEIWYYIAAALPLIITGGIHMDGFLDVTDARSSHLDKDRKLEILKDPHTGAFAIIGCGVYLLLYLGILHGMGDTGLAGHALSFLLSRSLSGLSVVLFPKAKNTGLASMFASQAQKKTVAAVLSAFVLSVFGIMIYLYGCLGALLYMAAAFLVYVYYYRMSMKEFGGITGDLAGYFLQLCELALLAVTVCLPVIAA